MKRTLNSAWQKLWLVAYLKETSRKSEIPVVEKMVFPDKFMGLKLDDEDINDLIKEQSD